MLTIFAKKLSHKCSTGFYIRLWDYDYTSMKLVKPETECWVVTKLRSIQISKQFCT